MDDLTKKDMRGALEAIASMISRGEKAREKFAQGTSQHSLQSNRIKALHVASLLISRELEESNAEPEFAKEDFEKVLAPITSLVSKCEKAQKNLTQGTWQYKMLDDNIKALNVALPLLKKQLDKSSG